MADSGAPATLHLTLEGLRKPRGTVRVCLWSHGDGFPDCKKGAGVVKIHAPVEGDRVDLDVAALPPGDYGVSVIHDENDNRKLDKSFIGLPMEGVGFSNNASAAFGPPKFKRVRFAVAGDTTQTIKLKYYL
ncbi:MAG: DUF2141 domain-containing protein [Pacificimonas sp.]|jgi:uncharacterized protein (DUF2141 family)|nr:DUF2141 domain-containing protein [Pacificimonas sp.]